MFESAELGHKLKKDVYTSEEPALREALIKAQAEVLAKAEFPIIIVIAGFGGAGKGETANVLNEWFDPRHVNTRALDARNSSAVGCPPLRAAWKALPSKGKIALFVGSWYTAPMDGRAARTISKGDFETTLDDAANFETLIANEGALILKFWLHLSKKAQAKRFRSLEKNPLTSWRVTKDDWKHHAEYGVRRRVAEETIRRTSTAEAPWTIVEGADREYRSLTVGKTVLEAMTQRLARLADAKPPESRIPPRAPSLDHLSVTGKMNLDLKVSKEAYDKEIEEMQGRLDNLFRRKEMRSRSVVGVFEGADAAGKGGAIRRITNPLDARLYRVIPIAAPTPEERAHPYLWRFWRHVPSHGRMTLFDRSWYGRVLVERVEGFCSEDDYKRAYKEINDFEDQLVRAGTIVVKYWLQISLEEQLKRFQEREQTGFKQYKIGPEDWRNRSKWDAYSDAVDEMVERTSGENARWTLVEANDKRHARVKVLKTLCDEIERSL